MAVATSSPPKAPRGTEAQSLRSFQSSQGDSTLANLRYSSFLSSLLAAIPEVKQRHDALWEDMGPDVLPYPTCEPVVKPSPKYLLKADLVFR